MRLRHIEIFHAVYLHGTVSAAARALNISQPAVTKTLKHAEQLLGFPLFDRRGGRLVPTDDAHTLFIEVADVQQRVSSLRQVTRNLRNGSGTLRVSVLPSLALDILPRAVSLFSEKYPDVYFDLQTLHHEEIARSLYEREADIVVAYKAPPGLPVITGKSFAETSLQREVYKPSRKRPDRRFAASRIGQEWCRTERSCICAHILYRFRSRPQRNWHGGAGQFYRPGNSGRHPGI